DRQLLGDLVELNLLTESALRRPVSALGPARRLVGEHPATLKVIRRDVVGHRLERTGIERARDAVRAVSATVEQRLDVQAGDGAVALHTGLEVHQDRMPAAVAVEDLLPRETDLHGAIEDHRRLGDYHFVVEGIALATEAATVWRGDDAHVR